MTTRHTGWKHGIPLALAGSLFATGLLTAGGGTASAAAARSASPSVNGVTITIALGNYDLLVLPPDPCRACTVIIPGVLAVQPEKGHPGS